MGSQSQTRLVDLTLFLVTRGWLHCREPKGSQFYPGLLVSLGHPTVPLHLESLSCKYMMVSAVKHEFSHQVGCVKIIIVSYSFRSGFAVYAFAGNLQILFGIADASWWACIIGPTLQQSLNLAQVLASKTVPLMPALDPPVGPPGPASTSAHSPYVLRKGGKSEAHLGEPCLVRVQWARGSQGGAGTSLVIKTGTATSYPM